MEYMNNILKDHISNELIQQLENWDEYFYDIDLCFENTLGDLARSIKNADTEADFKVVQKKSREVFSSIKHIKRRLAMLDAINTDDLKTAIDKTIRDRRTAIANFKPEYVMIVRKHWKYDLETHKNTNYIFIELEINELGKYKHHVRSDVLTKFPLNAKKKAYKFVENYLSTHAEANIATLKVDVQYNIPEYKDLFSTIEETYSLC